MKNKKIEVNYTSVVVLRVMVSLIFIVASLGHLFNTEKIILRIEKANFGAIGHLFGPPEIPIVLSGIVMLIAGIALAAGLKTRLMAIILIIVLIPITLTIQVGQANTIGPLFKNIAILGGLLFFVLNPQLNNKTIK